MGESIQYTMGKKLQNECQTVDPDQMPHSVASDLGLHFAEACLVPILRVITVSSV